MPKRLHFYDFLKHELEKGEDIFEEMYKAEADNFTEHNLDELVTEMYNSLDHMSILTEGDDWPEIEKIAIKVGVQSWLIARYARITEHESKKAKKGKPK